MFSSNDILRGMEKGELAIEPFDMAQLNPNSYDVRLGSWFYLLLPDNDHEPRYFGPLHVEPGRKVLVPAGMTLLGMTVERVDTLGTVLGQMRSKSSRRREGRTVCDDAGFGDVGYANHWTVELTAHAPGGVYLEVGSRFAQILFERTETPPITPYQGQYNAADWPACMLPKAYRGKAIPWDQLGKYASKLALLRWVK